MIREIERETGRTIQEIEIDLSNKVYCIIDGQRREICSLDVGLEFR